MNLVPLMADARDEYVPSADGTPLKAWLWTRPQPRGVLVIAHGLGEHGGCYRHVAAALASSLDIDILAFDFRGHGRSPGRRGLVQSFDVLTADLRGALAWTRAEKPRLPLFVLGHSYGGLVLLTALLAGEAGIAGLVLSNPALRLAKPVPKHKRWAGALLRRFAPGITLNTDLGPEEMTRDPASLAERQNDPLRHTRICAAIFYGMIEAGPLVSLQAAAIQIPTLMIISGADPIVDVGELHAFFDRLGSPDKTLRVFPDMLHEPLNELGRETVISEIAAWLAQRQAAPFT